VVGAVGRAVRCSQTVPVDAPGERLWAVLSDLEAWPAVVGTVEGVELLTPGPLGRGSRVRLRQAKVGEGTWEVAAWEPPSSFQLRRTSSGLTTVVDHLVEATGERASRLTLRLELRGLLAPVLGRLARGMTERSLAEEAADVKAAAEAAPT
jgi:carbon monoxide dehydrogenase subunit G